MASHKARQTARIVDATLRVIHAGGLSGVSMSKVAAAAGMTRQTVYNYFPDVESIVALALDEHSAAMERHLLDVIDHADGLIEKLRAFATLQISHVSPGHTGFRLEFGLSAQVRARLSAHTDTVKSALEQAIASAIEDGEIEKGIIPSVASELLWGIVEGAMGAALKHPDQKPYLVEAAVKAMHAAVRSEGEHR
ncbi:MAG: TetR/AcrR family transcriptional regulator [Deltaproteobacteria bacterium]|nr:TetR/AcrR family transcriptional regulator [Deltaproteobacteria bacterium]